MNSWKKKKQQQIENGIIKFFKKNWTNIVSIAVSISAVLISIQSNIYSRKSSNSNVLIEDIGEVYNNGDYETWHITVYGCNDDYSGGKILDFKTSGEFWLSNTGGLDTTLLATDFKSEINIPDPRPDSSMENVWTTSIYKHSSFDIFGNEIISLELPAGKGIPIYILADSSAFFTSSDKAISYFESLTSGNPSQERMGKRGTWIFRFSDGNTYTKTYNKTNIRLLDYIESKPKTLKEQLEVSCEEMYRKP